MTCLWIEFDEAPPYSLTFSSGIAEARVFAYTLLTAGAESPDCGFSTSIERLIMSEIARKLTISTIAGKASAWFKKCMDLNGEKLPLARIYGIANGYTAGATEMGEFLKFRGQFRGVNKETGETSDAPLAIFPTHIGEMLRAQLDGGAQSVQFAIDVAVKFDATSVTKYVYVIDSSLPPAQNDPLAAIEAELQKLALPAPTASNAPAADTTAASPAPAPAASTKGKR